MQLVALIRAAKPGKCGQQQEIEHIPTVVGQAVRVDNHGVLLLKGPVSECVRLFAAHHFLFCQDEIHVHVGDEHTLKIEVLLNTVFTQVSSDVDDATTTTDDATTCERVRFASRAARLSVCHRV